MDKGVAVSPDAQRLWQWFQASQATVTTVVDLARALGVSKTRVKQALLELEDAGFLSIQEDDHASFTGHSNH